MNKLFLIFSISLVLLATSLALARPLDYGSFFVPPGNSCDISSACVKSGGSCSAALDTDATCNTNSTNSSCCGSGLFCVNSTCVVDTIGEWCTQQSQCLGGGPFVACLNNTCIQQGLPGDGCSSDSDCWYSSSVCGNDSLCVGKPVNASCSLKSYECDAGLFCRPGTNKINGTCTAQLPANATCVLGVDVCALGNICSGNGTAGTNGTCVAPFQGGNNTKCHHDYECNTDLYCNDDNVCASYSTWSKTDCTNDTQCSNGGVCMCDTITGETLCITADMTQSYCADDLQSLYSCVGENNCSLYYLQVSASTYTLPSESCVATHCKSDFKKYNSCGCTNNKDLLGNCFQDQYCGGFPLWAIIVIAIVGVILVLVVIVVIVMVMRRRRSYDTIA